MRRAIAVLVWVLVSTIPAVIGVSAAAGVCVAVWNGQPITVLTNPRGDPGHPAQWIFYCLSVFFSIILAAGSFALYIPLVRLVTWLDLSRHDLPSKSLHPVVYKCMRWSIDQERRLVLAWMRRIQADLRDLERARKPDPVDPEF